MTKDNTWSKKTRYKAYRLVVKSHLTLSTMNDSDFVGLEWYTQQFVMKSTSYLIRKVYGLFIMVDLYYMCQVITVRNDLLVSSN